ncbi:MAG: tetratricopeptide repeat protein [Pseudomonadota bacterium]
MAILLVLVILAAGWYLLPEIKLLPSPRFNYILISVNGKSHEVFSGETLTFNPTDRVKIQKISVGIFLDLGVRKIKILNISTGVLFNFGFRLVAEHLDVNALRYKEMAVSTLLLNKNIFDHYRFRIEIKYRNEDLGYMIWEVSPRAEDWLDKANRTINKEQRIAVLGRALEIFPGNRELERMLLDEYKSLGRLEKATEMLEKMAQKRPDKNTLTELLEIYTATKAKNNMTSVLKRLVVLEPSNLEVRLKLAEFLEKEGKLEEAEKEYEALVKQIHENDRLPIYERLGYLYTKTGQLDKAISNYLAAVGMDKKDANIYYNLSYLYEKTGQREKAEAYLKRAVALRSEDLEGRMKLARNLIAKGSTGEAERYLAEVLKERPGSLEALMLMAKVFEKSGNKKNLKEVYKKILSLAPDNETIIFNMGILEYEDGALNESLPYLIRYIKFHPKDAAVREILFDIYIRQKNSEMAFREAEVLIELKPRELDLYDYMFEYLKDRGEYEKMISIMEKGVQANPKQAALREYLTVAYLRTGKEDLAVKQLEKMHELRPKDIDLLLNLARLQEKRNQRGAALNTFKKILELAPDHEEASEAYLRLRFKGVEGERTE